VLFKRFLYSSLTLHFRKTPLKTPLFLKATLIAPNICKGLTDKKCKRANVYKGPYRLTDRGEYIPPGRSSPLALEPYSFSPTAFLGVVAAGGSAYKSPPRHLTGALRKRSGFRIGLPTIAQKTEDVPEHECDRGEQLEGSRDVSVFRVMMKHVRGIIEDGAAGNGNHRH